MGEGVQPGPLPVAVGGVGMVRPLYAALLPVDLDAPAGTQHDLSDLADGGLVFFVPTQVS